MIKKILILVICMISCMGESNAIIYYSRTSGGNWNDNNSWSTTGYGQATNTGTFPKSGDYAYIGDGYTIIINTNCTTSYLFIGQGTSGVLEYSSAGNYTFTVINNITVNAGAGFIYTGNNSRTHTFQVGNNLVNNGNIDFFADANDVVNISFYRSANSVVSGNGTQDLNRVTISKTTSTSYFVDVQSSAFESGIKELVITYGTYHHNNSSTYEVNSTSGSGFNIPADGIVKVSQGELHLSPTQDETTLSGMINVSGGTLKVGSTNGNAGLRYDKTTSFVPRLSIESGNMEVFGGIYYKTGSSSSPLNFSISGGTLLLNSGTNGTADPVFHINDVTGSVCTFQDGTIIIQKPNSTGSAISDLSLCAVNGTVSTTGAFIQFGNTSSGYGLTYTFTPENSITFPNIVISGPAANPAVLCPSVNSIANINLISLNIGEGKSFDIRSASGATGDSRIIKLTGNYDGINSLFNDGTYSARNSTLILEGGEGQQIAGSGTISLHHFEINNGTGMTLAQNISISGTLTLNSGIIYTSALYSMTILSTAILGLGNAGSYIDGPLIREISTAVNTTMSFPIGKDGYYRPIQMNVSHSTSSTVSYTAELINSNPRALNYTLPGTIDRVSGVRYYSVSRSGAANLQSISYTIYYDSDDGVDDPTNLRIVTSNGASGWTDIGGTGSGTPSGSISSAATGSVSGIVAIGNANGGSNPLPVTWLYFNVINQNDNTLITWATAAEMNTDSYEVQRSINGKEFIAITRLSAAGNSNTPIYYSFVDPSPSFETTYYRIKQNDLNGQYTYSAVRTLFRKATEALLYPNPPIDNNFFISLSEAFKGPVTISTFEETGRIVHVRKMDNMNGILKLEVPELLSSKNLLVLVEDENGHQWRGRILGSNDE